MGWWADRADFPATSAFVLTPRTCATRWTTGSATAAETNPGTWHQWLGVADDSTAGLLDVLASLSHGTPLPLVDVITDEDTTSWHAAQSEHGDGWDSPHPDNFNRAATGRAGNPRRPLTARLNGLIAATGLIDGHLGRSGVGFTSWCSVVEQGQRPGDGALVGAAPAVVETARAVGVVEAARVPARAQRRGSQGQGGGRGS